MQWVLDLLVFSCSRSRFVFVVVADKCLKHDEILHLFVAIVTTHHSFVPTPISCQLVYISLTVLCPVPPLMITLWYYYALACCLHHRRQPLLACFCCSCFLLLFCFAPVVVVLRTRLVPPRWARPVQLNPPSPPNKKAVDVVLVSNRMTITIDPRKHCMDLFESFWRTLQNMKEGKNTTFDCDDSRCSSFLPVASFHFSVAS